MKITIDSKAYTKLLLHALKHHKSDCIGVLLGRKGEDKVLEVTDAVPLFH